MMSKKFVGFLTILLGLPALWFLSLHGKAAMGAPPGASQCVRAERCPLGQVPIGPAGPRGVAGPRGPAGPQGTPGAAAQCNADGCAPSPLYIVRGVRGVGRTAEIFCPVAGIADLIERHAAEGRPEEDTRRWVEGQYEYACRYRWNRNNPTFYSDTDCNRAAGDLLIQQFSRVGGNNAEAISQDRNQYYLNYDSAIGRLRLRLIEQQHFDIPAGYVRVNDLQLEESVFLLCANARGS